MLALFLGGGARAAFLSLAAAFASLWAMVFLAYLIASSIDEGHAEIVAAIRQASEDLTKRAPLSDARLSAGSLPAPSASLPHVLTLQDTDAVVSEPPHLDPQSASMFEELLGRRLLVRGYTKTEPPQFRRVEGVLSKDSAGQYWVGNSRVDNLKDTKLAIAES